MRARAPELGALRAALRAGGVALVPTDTVYGLAAALDAPGGVRALHALKGRSAGKPSQVLIYHRPSLEEVIGGLAVASRRAAGALLPGPATCLLPDPEERFARASGGAPGTVGIRAPRITGPLAGLDLLLVATSANHPGGPDPATLDQVPADLRAGAAVEVDAGRLPGTASAVVDLRAVDDGGEALLLRPGPDPAGVARALAAVGVRLAVAGAH